MFSVTLEISLHNKLTHTIKPNTSFHFSTAHDEFVALADDKTITVTQICVDRTKPNLSKADCDVGDDAILSCVVNDNLDRTYSLSWRRNNDLDDSDPLILVVGSQISIPDNRYNVTQNHRTNSLEVSRIR